MKNVRKLARQRAIEVVFRYFDIPERFRWSEARPLSLLPNRLSLSQHNFMERDKRGNLTRYDVDKYDFNKLKTEEVHTVCNIISDYYYLLNAVDHRIHRGDIIATRNSEIKSYLLTHYGTMRFFTECGGRLLHHDTIRDAKLYEIDGGNKEKIVMVMVKDSSTDQTYVLRVPPGMRKCKQAIAWTFGMTPEEYNPEKET